MKKRFLLCMCFALTLITSAQTEDKKWNIGLHGGITQYRGDLGSDFYKFDQSMKAPDLRSKDMPTVRERMLTT